MTLDELKIKEIASIVSVNTSESLKKRLYKMGLKEGEIITVMQRAPFFSPIQIKIDSFYLAIRSSDAKKIIVEKK